MVEVNGLKIADLGYFINLDEREDRKKRILEQLSDLNIIGVERFSAKNDSDSGPLNCKKSHYEIYKKLLESDGDVALVLEDDCLFLDYFKNNSIEIIKDIYSVNWDIFWLGCRHRRMPIFNKNNTLKVSSVSHAQSYLIKRNMCEHILNTYPIETHNSTTIDELLCLLIYGYDVVANPNDVNFYILDSPIEMLTTKYISLSYNRCLTTQYASFSDLTKVDVNYEDYIISSYPNI